MNPVLGISKPEWMEFLRTLLTTVTLLLLAVQVQSAEHCPSPSSIGEFKNTVIEAACSFDPNGATGLAFRNQTRINHGAGHKLDSECSYMHSAHRRS